MNPLAERRPVLAVTGAAGKVGTMLRPHLRQAFDLVLHDRTVVAGLAGGERSVVGDLRDGAESLVPVLRGADALLHLAGHPAAQIGWADLREPNCDAAYVAFEAARLARVTTVVLASSNHAMAGYARDEAWPITTDLPPRPDCLYGVSKVAAEAFGRYYADTFGLTVVCLRIGWLRPTPTHRGMRRLWISPRDLAQLVHRAVERGAGYSIYNGVSANGAGGWDITDARRDLGYDPLDDADDHPASHSPPPHPGPAARTCTTMLPGVGP